MAYKCEDMLWATPQTPVDCKPTWLNAGNNIHWQWLVLNFFLVEADLSRSLIGFVIAVLFIGFAALVSTAAYKMNVEKVREDEVTENIVNELKTGTGKSMEFLVLWYLTLAVYYVVGKSILLLIV